MWSIAIACLGPDTLRPSISEIKQLISFCNFLVEGIDARNSWKPDLGHKTGYCGPQRPKSDQKSNGQCVCTYVPPPAFLNHTFQSYEIRNLSSIYARRSTARFKLNQSLKSEHRKWTVTWKIFLCFWFSQKRYFLLFFF